VRSAGAGLSIWGVLVSLLVENTLLICVLLVVRLRERHRHSQGERGALPAVKEKGISGEEL
jgi:hypothetical protein